MLTGLTDPDYQEEIEPLLHSRGKEKYIWNTGDILVFPYPVIKDNHKNAIQIGLLMAQTLQEQKFGSPGKEP